MVSAISGQNDPTSVQGAAAAQWWSLALGFLGHDSCVKQIYERILRSKKRPRRFLDLGANVGGHSLLMAAAGVDVVAVEPNPRCGGYLEAVAQLNGLSIELIRAAVGSEKGVADLHFPENDTSLGRISLSKTAGMDTVTVPVITVDGLGREWSDTLIKIDTEGYELQVLIGASDTIVNYKPLIVFESLVDEADRPAPFVYLEGLGYEFLALPHHQPPVDAASGAASRSENFLAIPRGTNLQDILS